MSTCSCCTLITWGLSLNKPRHMAYLTQDYNKVKKNRHDRLKSIPFFIKKQSENVTSKEKSSIKDEPDAVLHTLENIYITTSVYICFYLWFSILNQYLITKNIISIYLLTPGSESVSTIYFNIFNYIKNNRHISPNSKAGGVIIYKNRVLIVQSNFNKWGFPKGHVKPGETLLQCAIREIKEETSIDVELSENDRFLYTCNNTALYYKRLTQRAKIRISQIIDTKQDCTGIAWIKLACLKKQVTGQNSIPLTSALRKFVLHYF